MGWSLQQEMNGKQEEKELMLNVIKPLILRRSNRRIYRQFLVVSGVLSLLLTVGLAVQGALARGQTRPADLTSPIHPTFALLDVDGVNVLDSGAPVSTMVTCGQCHDTDYIASNSFHTDLGFSDQVAPGQVPGGQAWDTSAGLYGKWDPLTYRYLTMPEENGATH